MTKEETNSWEEELMKIREQTHYPHLKTTRCFVVEDLKQFISKLISQEREKWGKEIEEVIEQSKPLYIEGENKDFTAGQEYTIRQFKHYFNLIQKQ